MTDEEWKKSRKILVPAFSSEMLTKYVDVFKKKSAALVRSFESAADNGQIIDVIDHVVKSNLEGIVGKKVVKIRYRCTSACVFRCRNSSLSQANFHLSLSNF